MNSANGSSRTGPSSRVLLDTSAVFVDLFGSRDYRDEIARIRRECGGVGISPYVRREAEYVLYTAYGTIFDVLGNVPAGERRTSLDIWKEI